MYEIKFEFRSVGLCGGFLFVSLFVPFFTSLPAYFFIYLFLPFIVYFFALSLRHSFYSFSIFLEPEPKLFHVTWVLTNYIDILFFTWSVMGNQNNIVKFSVPGIFWLFQCSRMLWGVPECSRLFRCACVPVFPVLVHVILLTIFDNA